MLTPYLDPTGMMSPDQVNAKNIEMIMNAFNTKESATSGFVQNNVQNTTINDGGFNRIISGYQQVLQQWGLFVSKPNINVDQATADQLIFNSNQDIFKIVGTSPAGAQIPALSFNTVGAGTFSNASFVLFPHGLNFIPSLFGYYLNAGYYRFLPFTEAYSPGGGGIGVNNIYIQADATNVLAALVTTYYTLGNCTNVFNAIPIKFFLLQETAN